MWEKNRLLEHYYVKRLDLKQRFSLFAIKDRHSASAVPVSKKVYYKVGS